MFSRSAVILTVAMLALAAPGPGAPAIAGARPVAERPVTPPFCADRFRILHRAASFPPSAAAPRAGYIRSIDIASADVASAFSREVRDAAAKGDAPFLIVVGERRNALALARASGWSELRPLAPGSVFRGRSPADRAGYVFAGVNDARALDEAQAALRALGLPPERLLTVGEPQPLVRYYADTFRELLAASTRPPERLELVPARVSARAPGADEHQLARRRALVSADGRAWSVELGAGDRESDVREAATALGIPAAAILRTDAPSFGIARARAIPLLRATERNQRIDGAAEIAFFPHNGRPWTDPLGHVGAVVDGLSWNPRSNRVEFEMAEQIRRAAAGESSRGTFHRIKLRLSPEELAVLRAYWANRSGTRPPRLQNCAAGTCESLRVAAGIRVPFPINWIPHGNAAYFLLAGKLGWSRVSGVEVVRGARKGNGMIGPEKAATGLVLLVTGFNAAGESDSAEVTLE